MRAWYKHQRMKRLLIVGLIAACASETVEAPPPVPADWRSINAPPVVAVKGPTAKERAIGEAYVAALGSPNLTGIGPLFDEIGHFAFGHHDTRGRDNVVKDHGTLFGAFDDRKVAVGRAWRTDDEQIVEWVMTGVQAREWMGVPATQRSVVIRGIAFLWTQDTGTVMDAHLYFSIPVVKAQLGVGPKELQEYVASVPPPPPSSPVLDQENSQREKHNEAAIRSMLDDFEHGREKEFLAAYTDTVVVEPLSRPKTQKKDDVHSYYRMLRRLIGQFDTTIVSVEPVQQFVLLENLISGEQYGPVFYTPLPSDKAAWIEMADVIEMTDAGTIAHIWRYENPDWP
jgi:hypothetical protein